MTLYKDIKKSITILITIYFICYTNISYSQKLGDLWGYCADVFRNIFKYKPQYSLPQLTEVEIEVWREYLHPTQGKIIPVRSIKNHDSFKPLMIWWLYEKLPSEIRHYIENPQIKTAKDFYYYLKALSYQYGSSGFLNQLADLFYEFQEQLFFEKQTHLLKDPAVAKDWIRQGLQMLQDTRTKNPQIDFLLLQQYYKEVDIYFSSIWWRDFYRINLPMKQIGPDTYAVTVGDRVFEAYIEKYRKTYYVVLQNVPRDQICIPAWNPLDHKYLAKLFNAEKKTYIPQVFYAAIGLDGRFYLQDGNHRFVVSSQKYFNLRVPYPPSTLSLREYILYINAEPPTEEEIIALYRKRTTIDKVIRIVPYHKIVFAMPQWDAVSYQRF